MDEMESLSHTKWECKNHVVFIPKCGRKTLYGELRQPMGEVFRKLAVPKESRIEEGHLLPDHVPMMIAIPPKYKKDVRLRDLNVEPLFENLRFDPRFANLERRVGL